MLINYKRYFLLISLIFGSHCQAMHASQVLLNALKQNTKHSLMSLKNGSMMRPKDIWATMSSLVGLATSDDKTMKDTHTLVAVLQNVFFNEKIDTAFIDKLKHLSLIDVSEKPTQNAIAVITSSLEKPNLLNKKHPVLSRSILRSPIKGRYLTEPPLITSLNYNASAYYNVTYVPQHNKLTMCDSNPQLAFHEIHTCPLRLESETKEDILPYFFAKGSFADPFDLQPIEEFINELEEHEYFQDIAQKIINLTLPAKE